jgi:hypothetical protein
MPTITTAIGFYVYNKRKKVFTDGEIVSGRTMNMFAPPQYFFMGKAKHVWGDPIPIDQEVYDSDNLYFMYIGTNNNGVKFTRSVGSTKGESKYIHDDKYNTFTHKKVSEGMVNFPWKYGWMERPLHLGLNTLDDQGVEFDCSFRGQHKNCFVTSVLEDMIYMQGYDDLYGYNRIYKITYPDDAKVQVIQRAKNKNYLFIGDKCKYIWCSDKVIVEEIPSDKYVEYIKKNYINNNKGVTEEEKNMLIE